MREKYMLAIANLVNGSELGYEDRSSIPQYKKSIEDYVDSLEKVNKEYEEVIDKLNENIIELSDNTDDTTCYDIDRDCKNDLLDILKEVE